MADSKPFYEPLNLIDERLNCSDQVNYAIYRGASSILHQRVDSSSCTTSNIQWNIITPGSDVVIDRNLIVEVPFTITFNNSGTVTNPAVWMGPADGWGQNLGFASFPLTKCAQTIACGINNTSTRIDAGEAIRLLENYMDEEDLKQYANTPTMLDYYQNYDDNIAASGSQNVLADAGGMKSYAGLKPRGNVVLTAITPSPGNAPAAGTPAAAGSLTYTVEGVIYEPVIVPPFMFGQKDKCGMYGVGNLSLNYDLTNVQNMFRMTAGLKAKISNFTVNFQGKAYLHMTYLSVPPSLSLDARCTVPYTNVFVQKGSNDLSANTTAQEIQSNNIQLHNIPDYVIIGVKKATANKTQSDADWYLPISNVSITFGTQNNLLSNLQAVDLFHICQQNGLRGDFAKFSASGFSNGAVAKLAGAPVLLKFGKDIAISDSWNAPGVISNSNFSAKVTVLNTTGVAQSFDLSIVFVSSGLFSSEMSASFAQDSFLQKSDVLNASQLPIINKSPFNFQNLKRFGGNMSSQLVGSGFWSDFGEGVLTGLKGVGTAAKTGLNIASQFIPDARLQAATGVANVLGNTLGFGRTAGAQVGGMTLKEKYRK